jgi:type VI secretion system protein ImpC
MPKPSSFGKIDFKIVASMEEARGAPEPQTRFRVLVLGDFSGRANRGLFDPRSALAERCIHLVDRDNLDEVMARLGVEIRLPLAGKDGPPVAISFSELQDFHPDRLFERLEMFKAIAETRRKLSDPSRFTKAAEEFRKAEKPPESPISPGETAGSLQRFTQQMTGSLLDQVLEETLGEAPKRGSPHGPSEWDAFLRRIVRPHLVPDIEKEQAKVLAAVDAATADLMRPVLHHPQYQEIEAAWRGLQFLVFRLGTDAELKLYLLDISKAELAADLGSTEELNSTGMYRLLVEETMEAPGGDSWTVLIGNYTFDDSQGDAELLGRMAKIARAAGAPFVTAASDKLLGCESLAHTPDPRTWNRKTDAEGGRAWEGLRKLPEASYLGLAIPRFLLRLPYGAETEPIEDFAFEEMEGSSQHDHYLWGNPSFACVYLLAQAFSAYGWDLRPGILQEIEGLPLHVYKEQGESLIKPCAEVVLTERVAEAILEKGFMPLLSFKDQDTVRLARFQSIADPPTHLAGRWSRE